MNEQLVIVEKPILGTATRAVSGSLRRGRRVPGADDQGAAQ